MVNTGKNNELKPVIPDFGGAQVLGRTAKEDAKIVQAEYESLMQRDVLVRRGRNNRIFCKFISKQIFEEDNTNSTGGLEGQ